MAQRESKPGAQVGWAARRSKPRPSSGSGTPQAQAQAPAPLAPGPPHALTLSPVSTSRPGRGLPGSRGCRRRRGRASRYTCIAVRWPISGPTPTTRATTFKARPKFPTYFHASSSASVSLPPRPLSSWPGRDTSAPTRPGLQAPHARPVTSPSARNSSGASPPSSATLLLGEKDLFFPAMVIHRERKENKGEEPALRNALEAGRGTGVGAEGGGQGCGSHRWERRAKTRAPAQEAAPLCPRGPRQAAECARKEEDDPQAGVLTRPHPAP